MRSKKISFEEYLSYDDGTNIHYELVDGQLIEMPPASFLHSDIIDFIADCFKAIATQYKLDIKVKTGDVGVRTGMNSSRIPDISVIDGQVWKSYRRDKSAVIEDGLMLAVEVVSPGSDTADELNIRGNWRSQASENSQANQELIWRMTTIRELKGHIDLKALS